jgi:hypothetical protein
MKQETNNEMDLLLRRLGRRDDAVVPEDHLDADELNAYAENALPATARARYTVHLAECASCRSLITQLSSSAGVVATTETLAVPEQSGFRKFLASLLTPMVLRYAAPALGLIVVAVIGFVVLRRDQAEKYVAQDTGQQHPAAAPAANSPEVFYDNSSKTTASPGRVEDERREKNQPAQPAAPPNAAPVVSSVESDVAKDKAAAQPKPEEQPAAANEAPPPAKPEPTPTPETEVTKKEVRDLPATPREAPKTLRAAEREDKDNFVRERKQADSVSASGVASVGSVQRGGGDFSANTRTVAGRRFRKQGGVWIDTAYDSSKNAMTLTRGSEQYRALVADEPAIKTIADQLDGEIIVVWKDHTYRIR